LIRPAQHKDVVALRPFLVAILCSFLLSGCALMLHDVEPSMAATQLPRLTAEEAAAVPEGARVEIEHRYESTDWEILTTGTVLKSSPEGLALANCQVPGTPTGVPIMNKVPYVSRLFKTTGTGPQPVPVLWVPLQDISSVRVVEPPPADYVASSIEISTTAPPKIGVDFDDATAEDERSPAALR